MSNLFKSLFGPSETERDTFKYAVFLELEINGKTSKKRRHMSAILRNINVPAFST